MSQNDEGKEFIAKYPVERIVIDSDLDGVLSGAILRLVFPEAEIIQSQASEIQEGKIDHLLNKKTLIVDLRYSPKCGYYFDHHESNKPDTEFIGSWKPYDSAAHVVYDYFKNTVDLSKFKKIIPTMDKIDAGKLTLEEFNSPTDFVQLSLVVSRRNKYFNLLLVELLAKFGIEKTCRHPYVKEKIDNYLKVKSNLECYIKNGVTKGDIALIDISDYKGEEKITSYLYTAQFPKAKVVVVIKPHEDKNFSKIRFYRNNFFGENSKLDLLRIALKISPDTAGGHKGACGFTLKTDFDREKLIAQIKTELAKQ